MKFHLITVLAVTLMIAGSGAVQAQQNTGGLSNQPPLWSERVADWEDASDTGIVQAFAMEIPSEPLSVQLGLAWYRWNYDENAYAVVDITTPIAICGSVLFQGITLSDVLNADPSVSSLALNVTEKSGLRRLVVLDLDHQARSAATPHCP